MNGPSAVPPRLPERSAGGQTGAATFAIPPSVQNVESLRHQIKQLEEQLSKATSIPTASPVPAATSTTETASSKLGAAFHFQHDSGSSGQAQVVTRSVMHKTRLFGQSHWIHGITLVGDLLEIMGPHLQDEASPAVQGVQKSKSLARIIKAQRSPPWPSPPTAELPAKALADELLDCYLRTTETFYRILHVPSFRIGYDALWTSSTKPDVAFLVQVKLVLAIGATVYDEQFSLRSLAMRWVFEAQTYLSGPEFKARLSIQSLQTGLLLLLARETADVGSEGVWISAGELLRSAIYMGLHRDPAHLPKRTFFAAEMRRRLWNTILELTLQSSLTSGGPLLLSLHDFDTEPPGNFDDDQLLALDPVPKQEYAFSQTSIAIALRRTMPVRLAVCKFLNDCGSRGTYEETLRLDAELRASCKELRRTIQTYRGPSPSQFEIRIVGFLTQRYLSSLHMPFFGAALQETAYAYSRIVVVESSLRIWRAAYPSPLTLAAPSERDDLARLTICGTGFFRAFTFLSSFSIMVELRAQMLEDDSLSIRPDLFSVLEEAKTWNLRCIEAGETSMKGYLFTCVIAAQIDGLMHGLANEDFPPLLAKAAENAGVVCRTLLGEKVAQGRKHGPADGLDLSLDMPSATGEDWDFLISDSMFDFETSGPMDWTFGDGTLQELSLW
ncbi:hypothetical protein LTR65_003642 [Meristemomyces frigidus]